MTSSKGRRRPVTASSGETVPLTIAVPGGMAQFYSPAELSPRRAREVEVLATIVLPKMRQLATASSVAVDGVVVDASAVLDGMPIGLSREEARMLHELGDVASWAYLKSWTVDRPLPASPDEVLDLPAPLYKAISTHAAKLLMAGDDGGFTVDALPDDLDEADPNLPTSPSGA